MDTQNSVKHTWFPQVRLREEYGRREVLPCPHVACSLERWVHWV